MPFDLLTLFEETEAALTRWDEGDESAAEAFAKRIFSLRPAYVSGTGYRLYREDAVTRYAQWILNMNRELGIVPCIEALYQFSGLLWSSDTPALTEEQVDMVFQMADQVFYYTQKVSPAQPIEVLLFDAQHESLNGETTAVFTPDGIQGCICMYRMREKSLSPIPILLHELGHLIHIRETGGMDQIPSSFRTYLRRLGIEPDALTILQLQDVFADTFMLAVMSRYPELEPPMPGLSEHALNASYEYMSTLLDGMTSFDRLLDETAIK